MRLIDADVLLDDLRKNTSTYIEDFVRKIIDRQPTVQPSAQCTLYGYDVNLLAMIAHIMQQGGTSPEEAVRIFKNNSQMILEFVRNETRDAIQNALDTMFVEKKDPCSECQEFDCTGCDILRFKQIKEGVQE